MQLLLRGRDIDVLYTLFSLTMVVSY